MNKNKGLWFYVKNYKFNSIFVRNSIMIVLLVIIPLGGLSFFTYRNTNRIIENEISQVNEVSLYRIRDLMDTVFSEANRLVTHISQMTDVQMFMLDSNKNEIAEGKYSKINKTVIMFTNIYDYIDSIYVYSEKSKYVISNELNTYFENFPDRTWYNYYRQMNLEVAMAHPRRSRDIYPFLLSFIKPGYLDKYQRIGCVVVNIDVEEFGKLIQSTYGQESQNIYILDQDNKIIYSNNREIIFDNAKNQDLLKASYNEGFSGITEIENKKYIYTTITSEINNWKCISVVPLEFYGEKVNSSIRYTLAFIIIFSCIGIIFSFLISIKAFNPIKKIMSILDNQDKKTYNNINDISNSVEKLPKSLFNKASKNINLRDNVSDELKYIANSILKADDNRRLMEDELERRLKLLNEAQASALQSQINPHFIYNTLENINWMAIALTNGENEVSATLGTLSQLMQLCLDMNNRLVPISEEIEHVKLYLKIMDLRYKDKFNVTFNISEDIYLCKIVKLSIQPLIENAVYHGIKPKRSKGCIKISAFDDRDDICIKIADDGIGMNIEKLTALNKRLREKDFSEVEHIGIKNVNQRIKLIFGDEYGIEVDSIEGEGTIVMVRIPKI